MKKIRVAVVFGGRSGEHEVSMVSAASVMAALDADKYEVVPVGITKEGRWLAGSQTLEQLKGGVRPGASYAMLPPDPTERRLLPVQGSAASVAMGNGLGEPFDVVIPILHGTFGEDGTVQGLLELAQLPYVGSGVLGSAVCMDKQVQKDLCARAGLPVPRYLWFWKGDWLGAHSCHVVAGPDHLGDLSRRDMIRRIEVRIRYPLFVKPANSGSSVGISKAKNRRALLAAVEEAGCYDEKILIEAAIPDAREIEISVLGNREPRASTAGEVIPSNEFYDYDAKYVDGKSALEIPAKLPKNLERKMREAAVRAFVICNCEGMARVDFLLSRRTGRFYLNELNTIPGFTKISMYPKLWDASGLPYPRLLDELIRLAVERSERKRELRTSYQPKENWFR